MGVIYPIISYDTNYASKYSNSGNYTKLISPVAGTTEKTQGVVTTTETVGSKVDYTQASNWFQGGATKEDFSTSKVDYYTITIPRLKINSGTVAIGGEDLSKSLIQYPGTALPGKRGNSVIFGHSILPIFYDPKNYISIFSLLPTLKKGDMIYVSYDGVSYTYQVETMFEVLKGFVPQPVKIAFRPVMVGCLVIAISLVSWGASANATYSLPGDALYGVKRAKEMTQVAVAGLVGGKGEQAKVLTQVAKNRAYETQVLVVQNKLDKVDDTLNSMTETINQAKENLNDIGEDNPEDAQTVAEDLTKVTGEIVVKLGEVLADAPKDGMSKEAGDVLEKIVSVQQDMANKGIEAVQVIVEKQQEGKISLTTEEIKDMVVKTTDGLVRSVVETVTTTVGTALPAPIVVSATDTTVSSSTSTAPATTESLNLKIDEHTIELIAKMVYVKLLQVGSRIDRKQHGFEVAK